MTEASTRGISAAFEVASDHPALAGHFPGKPVVPGVTLLQRVMALLEQHEALPSCIRLSNVKFLAPLLPDENARITIQRHDGGCRFECRAGPTLVARGDVSWDSPD